MKLCFLTLFLLIGYAKSNSQFYVGGGAEYIIPAGESADIMQEAIGLNLQFENRSVCWLWFGLHTSYSSLEPVEDYPLSLPYYESVLTISPTVRFNPFSMNCDTYNWVPFLKGQLNLGLVDNTDELSKFGVGTTFGAGLAYSFNLFEQCWMVEGGMDWSSPNNIILAEGREPLFLYKANFALTWRL